jgi:hypothetical protein
MLRAKSEYNKLPVKISSGLLTGLLKCVSMTVGGRLSGRKGFLLFPAALQLKWEWKKTRKA